MSDIQPDKLGLKMPGAVRRKAVFTSHTSQESLVKIEQLHPEEALPLLIQPAVDGVDLTAWAANNRQLIDKYLLKHGGILFRDLPLRSAEDFEQFITGVSGEPLEYTERSSRRSQISGNIYTSTDHPPDQSIFLHHVFLAEGRHLDVR